MKTRHKTPAKTQGLKPKMVETLSAIRNYFSGFKVSPTYQELADILGISKSEAKRRIAILVTNGHLANGAGLHRRVVITPRGYQAAGKATR